MVSEFLFGVKSARLAKKPYGKLKGILITYFFFSLSLVFFRSSGLRRVGFIFKRMFWDFDMRFVDISKIACFSYVVSVASIATLLLFEGNRGEKFLYQNYPARKEVFIISIMTVLLILFGVFYNVSFIYFQF